MRIRENVCINHHMDIFAHCDDLQLSTSHSWYFHKSGNHSVAGYEHMNKIKKYWENKRINSIFLIQYYKKKIRT